MESLVKIFDTDLNFWEANPGFKSIKVYQDLYTNDKSKNKVDSSQIMWAIALLIDMSEDNPWRNLSEEDKESLIAEDFLQNKKFSWKGIKALTDEYSERCLSIAEKALRNFNKKLLDRQKFIDNTKYTIDDADQLDKMMLNTVKVYQQYDLIKSMFNKEKLAGTTQDGTVESASEKGEI
jgi:hypothetical protein